MNIEAQINQYINIQAEPKRTEMQTLHELILQLQPACKLWYLDGKDDTGKIVSNPNIGYGIHIIEYAKTRANAPAAEGKSKEFYKIGLSANTRGISVYIFGIKDKKYLAETYGSKIGKATVTGYCINFKSLKDINMDILEEAIRYGFENNETNMQ